MPILTAGDTGKRLTGVLQSMHSASDIELAAATIMPDHVHLLFLLRSRLLVGQVMGKFKSLARDMGKSSWQWQQDGFEHQVRRLESLEEYAFYIFMNPYRAGLCSLNASWAWWFCPEPKRFRFLDALENGKTVPSAWLDRSDQIAAKITTGE